MAHLARGVLIAAALAAPLATLARGHKQPQDDPNRIAAVTAAGRLEVAFSPDEGAESLVVRVIDSARHELHILAYSFTSEPVTVALVRARHNGVRVYIVVDQRENAHQAKAVAALSALVAAGADVRTIGVYSIHHDKAVIADRTTVETGSFNFSSAAAHANSENVLVNWDNPALASVYLRHFERNYSQALPFRPPF